MDVIHLLLEHKVTVICAGGGGIPVVADAQGGLRGSEAVIDKDLVSALLARNIEADMLLMLTDVDAVYDGYGTPHARSLSRISAASISADAYPSGSMGPKIAAAMRFAKATGKPAAIGRLADATEIALGRRGTWIV